jgi:uridine phosphorylase
MQRIAESELIINSRGGIYHLNLRPEEIGTTVITVGDQARVKEVSKYFDRIEYQGQYREFVTHTGYIGQKKISVVSSGIGPDNIDIVINELDALVNIDLETRMPKEQLTSLNIIRFGTSGSLQADVPVDSLVAGTFGLGLDNLMLYYKAANTDEEQSIMNDFTQQVLDPSTGIKPYITAGSERLLAQFSKGYVHGITATCPGFYGPQGRVLRMPLAFPGTVEKLTSFKSGKHRIVNFEMESSAIYGLGKALGHRCVSLNAIVANRVVKEFSKDMTATVERLITQSLEVISTSDL